MTRVACAREAELVRAVTAGSWPGGVDPELRGHVAHCESCAEVAAIAPALRQDFIDACRDVQVPAAGQVWWRAAVRARLDAAETAAKPITWAQGLAGAGAAGLLVALIGMAWPSVLSHGAWAVAALLPNASAQSQVAALLPGLMRQTLPLLIVVAVCLVVAPVAVYLATSDE